MHRCGQHLHDLRGPQRTHPGTRLQDRFRDFICVHDVVDVFLRCVDDAPTEKSIMSRPEKTNVWELNGITAAFGHDPRSILPLTANQLVRPVGVAIRPCQRTGMEAGSG